MVRPIDHHSQQHLTPANSPISTELVKTVETSIDVNEVAEMIPAAAARNNRALKHVSLEENVVSWNRSTQRDKAGTLFHKIIENQPATQLKALKHTGIADAG